MPRFWPVKLRSGASLVEVIIASTIMSLLLTMSCTVIIAISRYFRRTLIASELHQSAITGLTSLSRELEAAHYPASQTYSDGIVFARPTLDATTLPPTLRWDRLVCYYVGTVQGNRALVRTEEPLVPSSLTAPAALPAGKDTAYFKTAALPHKLVCPDLDLFTVSNTDPAQVTLRLRRDFDKQYSVKVSIALPYRN